MSAGALAYEGAVVDATGGCEIPSFQSLGLVVKFDEIVVGREWVCRRIVVSSPRFHEGPKQTVLEFRSGKS